MSDSVGLSDKVSHTTDCVMVSNRFACCVATCLRKKVCWGYGFNNIFIRYQCSQAANDGVDSPSNEDSTPKGRPKRLSKLEITHLNEMKSRLKALHGLPDDVDEHQIKHEPVKDDYDYDFDYFESNLKDVPDVSDSSQSAVETDFIKNLKLRKKRDAYETGFGKVRMDGVKENPDKRSSKNKTKMMPEKKVKQLDPSKYKSKGSVETEELDDMFPKEKHKNKFKDGSSKTNFEDSMKNEDPSKNEYKENSRKNNFKVNIVENKLKDSAEIEDSGDVFLKEISKNKFKDDNSKSKFKDDSKKNKFQGSLENHGEDVFSREKPKQSKSSTNLFDDQYFNLSEYDSKSDATINKKEIQGNFIEEQFFPRVSKNSNVKNSFENVDSAIFQNGQPLNTFPSFVDNLKEVPLGDSENFNFIDQQIFHNAKNKFENEPNFIKSLNHDTMHDSDSMESNDVGMQEEDEEEEDDNTTRIENLTRRDMERKFRKHVKVEDPKTAYEAVLKIRQENQKVNRKEGAINGTAGTWNGEVDSKGFRILTSQTQDLQRVIDLDLVTMLSNSILFENEEIIAINKPYGLPSHGGPEVFKSVASIAEKLAARREHTTKTYHVVHRLDKETTGVMLLAKTERSAQILTQMFLKRQVVKVYWALTKGVPNPMEGIIDIPIGEEEIGGKYRMNLFPKHHGKKRDSKKSPILGPAQDAVTHYTVLDSNNHSALVECRPETGLKHQIRCHLAFALNTPILGDHKYSHTSKLAPQKLYPQILKELGIRQAKTRHLAMHLHAKSLVLPEYLPDGRNLSIQAHLPPHFVQNMKWLKLKPQR